MNTHALRAPDTSFERRFERPAVRRMALSGGAEARRVTDANIAWVATVPTDHDFMALHTAYRRVDGLARAPDLSRVWANDGVQLTGRLEQLIDSGRVFAFHWHDALWLPRFQLDRARHDTTEPVRQVLDELDRSHDGWEIAAWFVEPNVWLDDRSPVDMLAEALPQVLAAARADRFVRCG